jgi:glycosyltransferase involved in cell wall biosynthesis
MLILALIALALSALPAWMTWRNLKQFQPACSDPSAMQQASAQGLSVLIPARNEEASIQEALASILRSNHPEFEIVVMDDASEDRTAEVVRQFAATDPRVRLVQSTELPVGWNGKQYACWGLASHAHYGLLLFLDADVRLARDALTRLVAEQQRRQSPLISGFPYQETKTWSEQLLIPLMHYVLLGFLPIDQMRATAQPGFAAGCGQLFLAERESYFQVGGHSAIAPSRHDGIRLPKAFRNAGKKTDIFDATDLATCRMYQSLPQVVRGLLKNATEGIANPRLILPFTVLLLGGSVLPVALLVLGFVRGADWLTLALLIVASGLSWYPRIAASFRFRQPWLGVLLHPLSIVWFTSLQWIALGMGFFKIRTAWRGRLG